MNLLEMNHVKKSFGDLGVIQDISLHVGEGEIVTIIGPSGSGKSTLLRCATMLETMDSGELIYLGEKAAWNDENGNAVYASKPELKKIQQNYGLVFQNFNLFPHYSVLRNVMDAPVAVQKRDKEEARKTAMELLEKMGLADKADAYPCQLSGGQCQRVAIARAIVNNPDIILADEPTGALDSATSVQIMEILKEISKDKLVIMVTHNPQLADEYSSRIIRLKDGSLVSDSNPFNEQEMNVDTSVLKRPGMSFKMACSLSLNNLMTKKARTFLTSFAGSIGIIGIALIMSLSHGMQSYIDQM